jgi:hypothetical protein
VSVPEALGAALGRLREAARALREEPPGRVLDALGGVLDEWRDAASAPRRALADELPKAAGFTRPVVERGLALALAGWSGAALRALYERELGPVAAGAAPARLASGFETVSVLLAGAIPSASLVGLLAPLALRSAVLARPAARDPLTAPLLRASLARQGRALAAALEVTAFDARDDASLDAFLAADAVVATGSDETVGRVAARVAPPRRVVGYGHRVSFAALGPAALAGAPLRQACARLAVDVALWDQLGCLSPVSLFVAGDARAARAAAEALGEALEAAEAELPRGEVAPEAAAAIAHERAEAELRAAARGRAALLAGRTWTVVAEEDAQPRPAPLHRFVRVVCAGDLGGVLAALAPYGPHLAALGAAGFGTGAAALARGAAALGASRVCALGRMQAPPLDWPHDGQGVLLPLARLTGVEDPADL